MLPMRNIVAEGRLVGEEILDLRRHFGYLSLSDHIKPESDPQSYGKIFRTYSA